MRAGKETNWLFSDAYGNCSPVSQTTWFLNRLLVLGSARARRRMMDSTQSRPPFFVAEVSSNHARDVERCFRFIRRSAEIGCHAVKFQLFRVEELFAPEALASNASLLERRAWELPTEYIPELATCCRESGLKFACTPFSIGAVDELQPHVDFLKVASYELLWDDLLTACARTGKPVVLSTGMATMAEVEHAVATLRSGGCEALTLLHCVSGYPTPIAECNLAAIATLRDAFACSAGWSDHSRSPSVVTRAVLRWRAEFVEFHLDLDGEGAEYSTGHCWLPEEIEPVIASLLQGTRADGSGDKLPTPAEMPDREWRADPADGLRPLRRLRETLER